MMSDEIVNSVELYKADRASVLQKGGPGSGSHSGNSSKAAEKSHTKGEYHRNLAAAHRMEAAAAKGDSDTVDRHVKAAEAHTKAAALHETAASHFENGNSDKGNSSHKEAISAGKSANRMSTRIIDQMY